MRNLFTDKDINKIKKNLTILIDTREQRNEHIIEFFRRNNINYKSKKLDFGDYSCYIPANTLDNQPRDIYFDRDFVIERKNSIDELAGNFKDDGVRVKSELANIKGLGIKVYLLMEEPVLSDINSYLTKEELDKFSECIYMLESKGIELRPQGYFVNLRKGKFRSLYKPSSLYARIKKSLEMRYDIPVIPIGRDAIGSEIYENMQGFVYEKLKHEGYLISEADEDTDSLDMFNGDSNDFCEGSI